MSIDIERVRLIKEWEVHKPKISPIIFTSIDGNVVVVKDESVHPTGTYKALHGWMLGMHYLQNNFPNPFNYYLTSTGNAVMADFYYTKLLNRLINQRVNSSFDPLRTFSFFPAEYKDKLFGPDSNGKFLHGKDLIKFLT